jgi:hypothetical protein
MKKDLRFNKNFEEIKTLEELKDRVFINALSFTNSIKHAALEIGTSERNLFRYLEENKIDFQDIVNLRKDFKSRKIKIIFKHESDY